MDTSAKLFRALIDDLKDQADLIQNDVTSFQKGKNCYICVVDTK